VKKLFLFAVYVLPMFASGCTRAIGPHLVVRDRTQYSESISDSWKDQTLLNIVKLRYSDPPTFVNVASIVASYSLVQNASAGGTIQAPSNSTVLGASGSYSNSPTITYTPLTGSKFIKDLMTPLPPESVFFAIQAGVPADSIMFSALTAINGLKNQESTGAGMTPADPEFHQVRALLRKVQVSGAVRMYVRVEPDKRETSLLAFRTRNIPPETLADVLELRRLLHLNADATEFKLVFGPVNSNDNEVAVLTRSILSLMKTMAAQVEVPPEDLAQHLAFPGFEENKDNEDIVRLIRIHGGKAKPVNFFVAVNYHDTWFWIDNGDFPSKEVFSTMMLLFTMADTNPKENPLPIVTIPAH
jgi:hypothetical protein